MSVLVTLNCFSSFIFIIILAVALRLFVIENMRNHIKNWHIDENADTEFDHEVILFTIVTEKVKLVENSLNASQKAD